MKEIKKIYRIVIGVILLGSISGNIILGSSYGVTKQNEKNLREIVKEIEEDYNRFQEKKKEQMEAVCDLYYETKLKGLLDKDELDYLAFMSWEYKITVNGEEVTAPIVNTRSDVLRISFTESKISDNLPQNILNEGKFILSEENFQNYFRVEFRDKTEVSMKEENGNRILTYIIKEVQVGDVITIRLADELIQRLMLNEKIKLQDDRIEIIRNR